MPKIKLTLQEMKRISFILSGEIHKTKSQIENIKNQEFLKPNRKEVIRESKENDLDFLELIKNKFDSETFGRNG